MKVVYDMNKQSNLVEGQSGADKGALVGLVSFVAVAGILMV